METTQVESMSQIEHVTLVKRFQSGESSAFDDIVNSCRRYVYNLAYSFTRNCEDAYDISQEVFIKVFRSLNKLRNSSAFDIWLRRITINTCTDYLRSRSSERILEDFSLADDYYLTDRTLPGGLMDTGELQRMISRAVDQLPKRQRKVFILRHYEGLRLKDIARTLNCSLGTVKAHLFRATRKLRESLLPYVL